MSRAKGNIAENRAADFLVQNGYMIIERNFYSRFGEIDIIATKDNVLHFVEVKSALSYELAVQNLTPKKISRLVKTGDVYMKKNGLDVYFVYDGVLVMPSEVKLLENITL